MPAALGTDRARSDDHPATTAAEVARRLPATARRISRPGERGEHELLSAESTGEGRRKVAVIETEAIAAGFQRRDRGHLGDLVPARRNDERQLAGAVQDEAPVVEGARAEHRPVGVENLVPGEWGFTA